VFVGGGFTQIVGQARRSVAELDMGTGSATPWNPDASGPVVSLVVEPSAVWLGGGFSSLGALPQASLAHVTRSHDTTSRPSDGGADPAFALEGARPHPATRASRLWFTLATHAPAWLEVMDVAGRRIERRPLGTLGPGRHSVEAGATFGRPGLYFLRLTQDGRAAHARVVALP
jgi:hypothetical protein